MNGLEIIIIQTAVKLIFIIFILIFIIIKSFFYTNNLKLMILYFDNIFLVLFQIYCFLTIFNNHLHFSNC